MDRELLREIRRLIEPLSRKVRLVASRAVVELVKDSIGVQGVQVSLHADEVSDDATEHMQPGGLTHVPLAGAEGVYLSIGGVRDDGVLICVSDRRHRPKGLQGGETCLYSEGDKQAKIHLKADGSIDVVSPDGGAVKLVNPSGSFELKADGKVNINGVVIDTSGNIVAPGEVTAKGASPSTAVKLSTHIHPTGVGPSSAPTPGT